MFKRSATILQIFTVILVLSLVVDYCHGQVTFSRGWTPGKRGREEGLMEHHVAMKTATQLYRMLINQIQQLLECTVQHAEENENTAVPMYT